MLITKEMENLRKAFRSKSLSWLTTEDTGVPYLIGSNFYVNNEWLNANHKLSKFTKGKLKKPPKEAINLHDESYIEALIMVTREDGLTFNIINTWYHLGEKAKGNTKVLWEWYEKSPQQYKAKMLITIMRVEGKDSKAIEILKEMQKNGELTNYEVEDFRLHCKEFTIDDTFLDISSHISQLTILSNETKEKAENLYKGKLKEESLEIIERYEEEINNLNKTITKLNNQLRDKSIPGLEQFISQFEDKPLDEEEKRILKSKFDALLKIDCSSVNNDEDKMNCRKRKGKILEDFCESFFTAVNGIVVYDRDIRLKTEEIDLFLQNNTRKAYWNLLQSPNIIVECKNWLKPVGANEIRAFRQKINDHRNLVKVGFFISISGFTDGLTIEIIRSQKDENVLGFITKNDFENFFESNDTLLEFLESIIFKSIK